MRKIFTTLLVLLLGLTLVACKKDFRDGTYRVAFGEAKNLNSLTTDQASDSDVFDYLIGGYYETDYDWPTAIEKGIAKEVGDFSKIYRDVSEKSAEKPYSIDDLGYNRFLSDAATFPLAVNKNEDATKANGQLDMEASKELIDTKWRVTLKKGLKFSNGTEINARTVEYSMQQYLSPTLLAVRGNHIYDKQYLNIKNAREYYFQKTPLKDENGETTNQYPEEVAWEDVGFKVIDDYTFEFEMNDSDNQWSVMGSLGIFNLVEPTLFENGYNADRTVTKYGSIDVIPPSYGPYVLTNWEQDQKFTFTRNETYHSAHRYQVKTIDGPIIKDQGKRIDEFKAGNLDVAGVSGVYYPEFVDNPGLYITPTSQFMRLDFSIDRSGATDGKGQERESLILKDPDFRQALLVGIDRNRFVTEPVSPAAPLVGYASNIHRTSEEDNLFYNDTPQHQDLLEDLGLDEAGGYNPEEAKRLFNKAYDKLVSEGKLAVGQKAKVQYGYYDVESNQNIAKWLKSHFEELFGTDKFEWENNGLGQEAHQERLKAGDFDIVFAGLSGGNYITVILFDMVYASGGFFDGKGWELGKRLVEADIPNVFELINKKAEADRTDAEKAYLAKVDNNGKFTGTFDGLTDLFDNLDTFNQNYAGRDEDLRNIVQAFERVMFDVIPSVPLFSSVTASVYSSNVTIHVPAWNERMGWGGLRYVTINKK